MVSLEEEIKRVLKGYKDSNFYVVFNYDYRTYKEKDKTYSCVVKLNNSDRLIYGYLKRESKPSGSVDIIHELKDEFQAMSEEAKDTMYHGYETLYIDEHSDKNTFKVKVYPEWRVLAIVTEACDCAYYAVKRNINKLKTGIVIEGSDWRNFKTEIQAEAISRYEKFISAFLIPRINKKKKFEFFKKDFALVDVNTQDSGMDLLMFNPFRQIKDFQLVYAQSFYLKACKDAKVVYGNLEFSFLTYQELCKAFGCTKYMKMPFSFSIKLLAGIMNSLYPNTTTKIYLFNNSLPIEGINYALSTQEYLSLEPHIKPAFTERDTLYYLCRIYMRSITRSKKLDRTQEVYNICKGRSLVKYVE